MWAQKFGRLWTRFLRRHCAAVTLVAACALTGCGTGPSVPSVALATNLMMHGHVHGGQQPVSGALIGLWAAGTGGPGSAATTLLSKAVYSDNSGDFDLDGVYSCPSADAQVLMTAQAGNPGFASPVNNTQIAMVAALGPCAGLSTQTYVNLNEETTVAAVWALAPFMTSLTNVGSTAGDPLFADAVLQAQQLVDLSSGMAPGAAATYAVPTAKVNHLADMLAACINSTGGKAGDGTRCGDLFAAATPQSSAAPTDTVAAALNIARNPALNVSALFSLLTPTAPFQPVLTSAPVDWSLTIAPIPSAPTITPGSGTYTGQQAVTIAEATPGALVHFTVDGSLPSGSSPLYTAPFSVSGTTVVRAMALLAGLQSATSQATITLQPASPTRLAFVQQPASAAANAWLPPVTVQVLDTNGNPSTSSTAQVTLALASGTGAVLSGPTTQNAVNGVATFTNLSVSNAGSYSLVASSSGLTSTGSASFTISAPPSSGELATNALAFTDTLGMNIHLSYTTTLYGTNFPLILSSLQDLGVRHVRDGLIDFGAGPNYYYNEYQQLAAQGIRADYITSIGQSKALIQAYPARVGGMEALEAPNEYDTSGDPNWASHLAAFLPVLQDAVHGANPMPGVTLFGPSLVNQNWTSSTANSYALLGSVSSLFDTGNLHNYPGGRNPGTAGWTPQGYGSIAFAMQAARQTWPSVPLVTTETGYWDDAGVNESVPDAVIGRYTPRILLEQYLQGIGRTYLYELLDDAYSGGSYGLLRSDGSKKPAYLALQGLMHTLSDPGTSYSTTRLPWTLNGAATDLHHLLLQKRDGTFLLALWVEEPAYDVNTKLSLTVAPQKLALQFASPVHVTATHQWQADGSVVTATQSSTTSSMSVSATDLLTVIELHL